MPTSETARLTALYRYPVKGLSPERMQDVALDVGKTFPFDRAYAIENGVSGFDMAAPSYFPKIKFLMLMKQERLAELTTSFEDDSHVLTVSRDGKLLVSGCLQTEQGRADIEGFFGTYCADEMRGEPKVLHSDEFSFSDVPEKCISIINLQSVRDLERKIGKSIDPLRFRGNVYIDGIPAWSEFDWAGKTIQSGAVSLSVFSRIQRCAATNVDPVTGARDLQIPNSLVEHYGHRDCGVYATVQTAGRLTEGQRLELSEAQSGADAQAF